jgi:hypothetical protein
VLQNWFAADFDHRFGKIGGQFAHARAPTRCEDYRFVDLAHLVMSSEVACQAVASRGGVETSLCVS